MNKLFIIDAGHAPSTPGKRSPELPDGRRMFEWEFNRSIARALCERLSRMGVANHELVPHVDEDIGPTTRAQMANYVASKVDLEAVLVSIHSNAHGNGSEFNSANGVTVLYWHTSTRGKEIAGVFQSELLEATGWYDRDTRGRDNLSILKHTAMPAVLTENGFYTHEEQCVSLLSSETRASIVHAHALAIEKIDHD